MADVAVFALGGLTALLVWGFVVIPLFQRLVRKLTASEHSSSPDSSAVADRGQTTE